MWWLSQKAAEWGRAARQRSAAVCRFSILCQPSLLIVLADAYLWRSMVKALILRDHYSGNVVDLLHLMPIESDRNARLPRNHWLMTTILCYWPLPSQDNAARHTGSHAKVIEEACAGVEASCASCGEFSARTALHRIPLEDDRLHPLKSTEGIYHVGYTRNLGLR